MGFAMKKVVLAATISAAALVAVPADAAIIISVGGSGNQGQTVQFNTTQSGTPVTGTTNQTNTGVIFTRTGGLQTGGIGQAVVTDQGSSFLTGTTNVDLAGNAAASYLEFNLPGVPGNPPPAEATTVTIFALDTVGNVLTSQSFGLTDGGQNFFNITGTMGDTFGGFRVTLNPTGTAVSSLQNVRVITANAVAAVPEPGTWAMMLLGFGAIGFATRRRRSKGHILQLA